MRESANTLSVAPLTHPLHRDDHRCVVFCFAKPEEWIAPKRGSTYFWWWRCLSSVFGAQLRKSARVRMFRASGILSRKQCIAAANQCP
jgi:hypothetical protein